MKNILTYKLFESLESKEYENISDIINYYNKSIHFFSSSDKIIISNELIRLGIPKYVPDIRREPPGATSLNEDYYNLFWFSNGLIKYNRFDLAAFKLYRRKDDTFYGLNKESDYTININLDKIIPFPDNLPSSQIGEYDGLVFNPRETAHRCNTKSMTLPDYTLSVNISQ